MSRKISNLKRTIMKAWEAYDKVGIEEVKDIYLTSIKKLEKLTGKEWDIYEEYLMPVEKAKKIQKEKDERENEEFIQYCDWLMENFEKIEHDAEQARHEKFMDDCYYDYAGNENAYNDDYELEWFMTDEDKEFYHKYFYYSKYCPREKYKDEDYEELPF